MSQTQQLVSTLKRLLKMHGLTYADVATRLQLSEASVKRLFSTQRFSLQTLESICDLMQLDLADLVSAANEETPPVKQLTVEQEAELVAEPARVLIAVCVLNHWTLAQIVSSYRLSEPDCLVHLLQMERLGMLSLMAENRVKLRIARDFAWLPGGPIHQFFRASAQNDFLTGDFDQAGEVLRFQHAMLSPAANLRFQQRLLRLVQEFSELHEDGIGRPGEARHGTSLLLAMRPWEPAVFENLRRTPDTGMVMPG